MLTKYPESLICDLRNTPEFNNLRSCEIACESSYLAFTIYWFLRLHVITKCSFAASLSLTLDFSAAEITFSILKKTQTFCQRFTCSKQLLIRVYFVLCPYTNPINKSTFCCQLSKFRLLGFRANIFPSQMTPTLRQRFMLWQPNRSPWPEAAPIPTTLLHAQRMQKWSNFGSSCKFQVAKRNSRNAGPSVCFRRQNEPSCHFTGLFHGNFAVAFHGHFAVADFERAHLWSLDNSSPNLSLYVSQKRNFHKIVLPEASH